MPAEEGATQGVRGLGDLDRVIHEPGRLMVVAILYAAEKVDFLYLRRQTGLTGGNLSSHMSKLEGAGYVTVEKRFNGKMPQTLFQLTKKGRKNFRAYRDSVLEALGEMPR